MIEKHIVEATECDFKVALEMKKPKSWLKASVHLQIASAVRCSLVLPMTEAFMVLRMFRPMPKPLAA